MFIVCVTFDIHPDAFDAFLPLVKKQSENSLALEGECHTFDVCLDDDAARVFLYEAYSDRAAFDAHMKTEHFLNFDAKATPMIAAKDVKFYSRAG